MTGQLQWVETLVISLELLIYISIEDMFICQFVHFYFISNFIFTRFGENFQPADLRLRNAQALSETLF